jgi:hypothetical protein
MAAPGVVMIRVIVLQPELPDSDKRPCDERHTPHPSGVLDAVRQTASGAKEN